jgi:hydroxyacylglutathione hydrolase
MRSVIPVPAFTDNYIWLLRETERSVVGVVDPGDEQPVLAALQEQGLQLDTIFITHHHDDHVGGVPGLLEVWPDARVLGPRDKRIPVVTQAVGEGDRVDVRGLDMAFEVLEVPGHTSSHIAYLGGGMLFCGDTLFAAGCGRVFDGTFDQLAASLERIGRLPAETLVYCAHEYTLANLGFAFWVEPDNPALARRAEAVKRLRELGRPTVPSCLSDELATNPFLRTGVSGVKAAAERFAGRPLRSEAEVFTALRRWKDERYD